MDNGSKFKCIADISRNIIGPTIYEYTHWIITEALKRKLSTVYFLSRDGFLLWKTALEICQKNHIDLECRYLYISRMALRMASYCIAEDEVTDLLFQHRTYMTPCMILNRLCFDQDEKQKIYNILNITDENTPYNRAEADSFKDKLLKEDYFLSTLKSKSVDAHKKTLAYFRQEKLFEQKTVVLVDSGWNGSIQKSLNRLLKSNGYSGRLLGFYFGLVSDPGNDNGEYITFYFSANKGLLRKTFFNNNVFECMLPADHPMTMGYEQGTDAMLPKLAKEQPDDIRELLIARTLDYIRDKECFMMDANKYVHSSSVKRCYKVLKRFMVYPTADEIAAFGAITFCDDITDGYMFPLVDTSDKQLQKQLTVFGRIHDKLLYKNKTKTKREILWEYGLAASHPKTIRWWYSINLICWNLLRHIVNSIKNSVRNKGDKNG